MDQKELMEIFKETGAILEGHFLLSSGKHSGGYVQCAKVLAHPEKAESVVSEVVEKIKDLKFDYFVGPAMGGVIPSYEFGRQMNRKAIFTERKDNEMCLRRGFEIAPGDRIIIAEDVITTGKSTMEVKNLLESLGAEVVAAVCLVDRGGSEALDFDVYSAVKADISVYEPDECPMCKNGIPWEKPGSRKMT